MKRLIVVAMFGLVCTIALAQKKTVESKTVTRQKELVNAVSLETGKTILEKPVEKTELGSALFLSGFVGKYTMTSQKTRLSKKENKKEVFEIK